MESRLEVVKIVMMKEPFSQEIVPQSNSSVKEYAKLELPLYQWNIKLMIVKVTSAVKV